MGGNAIELSKILGLMGFPSPWEFDGLFIDEEREHYELRFSCPRGTRHHCAECGVVDQPAHDFHDLVWEHHQTSLHRKRDHSLLISTFFIFF